MNTQQKVPNLLGQTVFMSCKVLNTITTDSFRLYISDGDRFFLLLILFTADPPVC